ncbi:sigma-70 family RNA polymerase sigma factor [Niabella aquatica]
MDFFNTIAALKQADTIVFSEVFYAYHQRVYYYVLSKTNSAYIAEETTQLTFIKLWDYRNSLDESLSLPIQIFRIAKTTCIDLLRKELNRERHLLASNGKKKYKNDVLESLQAKELQVVLTSVVEQMPPVRRRVFTLSRFESRSNKEIAQMLSLSVRTVECHISMALKQLSHLFLPLFIILFF